MDRKARDIPRIECIGLIVEIVDAKNASLIGLKGKIVDETKNLFEIETDDGTKKIIKEQITFITEIDGKKITINGEVLKGRPEDRLKKNHRI